MDVARVLWPQSLCDVVDKRQSWEEILSSISRAGFTTRILKLPEPIEMRHK